MFTNEFRVLTVMQGRLGKRPSFRKSLLQSYTNLKVFPVLGRVGARAVLLPPHIAFTVFTEGKHREYLVSGAAENTFHICSKHFNRPDKLSTVSILTPHPHRHVRITAK